MGHGGNMNSQLCLVSFTELETFVDRDIALRCAFFGLFWYCGALTGLMQCKRAAENFHDQVDS